MSNTIANAEEALDILLIQRTISRIGTFSDQKRWSEHRQLFADEVTIDFGGVKPSQTIKADELVGWAEQQYAKLKTQHMFTNFDVLIEGATAKANSYGRALHRRTDTGEEWMIYNRYEHELVKDSGAWKVTRLFMEVTFQTGNEKLIDEASSA